MNKMEKSISIVAILHTIPVIIIMGLIVYAIMTGGWFKSYKNLIIVLILNVSIISLYLIFKENHFITYLLLILNYGLLLYGLYYNRGMNKRNQVEGKKQLEYYNSIFNKK